MRPGEYKRTKQYPGSEEKEGSIIVKENEQEGNIIVKEAHIIGGDTAELKQFPWAAALFIDGAWFCGGSLVSRQGEGGRNCFWR